MAHQPASMDMARHLLRPSVPVAKPATARHTQIPVDSKVLETCAGRYEAKSEIGFG